MIKDAMQFILGLAPVEKHNIDGRVFSDRRLFHISPPSPASLEVSTLQAVVDWLNAELDVLPDTRLIVTVNSPTSLTVQSQLCDEERVRETLVEASAMNPAQFPFGTYLGQEEFVVRVQTAFCDTEDRKKLLLVAGTLKEKTERTFDDDGVSQMVTASDGLSVGNVKLPNPVLLHMYRTFPELDQPECRYIFRARGGDDKNLPNLALFEVGDGRWRLQAVADIASWLTGKINLSMNVTVLY